MIHTVTVQRTYSFQEELAAYEYGSEHPSRNIAEYWSLADAEGTLDDIIESPESKRDRIVKGQFGTE